MRSPQVLDQQNDLHTRLSQDPRFWQLTATYFAMGMGSYTDAPEDIRAAATDFTNVMAAHVQKAYAYHVSEDMSALVEHAAAGLDETDVFDAALAPTLCGMAYFDRPLAMIDARGRSIKVHWLIWGPAILNGDPATLLTVYNDPDDPDEYAPDPATRFVTGRWGWIGATATVNGDGIGPARVEALADQNERIAEDGDTPVPATNPARFLYALWLLIGQPVAALSEPDLNRADRKRIGRMPTPGKVSVIGLRQGRDSARAEGESSVEWKHRWLVRGHWRWTPTGPLNTDLHDHRWGVKVASVGSVVAYCQHDGCKRVLSRVWVNGHVKGPQDKPLVVTDKVYRVDR